MIKSIRFILLFGLFTSVCFSQTAPNVTISTSPIYAGEPFMAINPTNPKNIIIAYMTVGLTWPYNAAIKTMVSFDGGSTWGNPHYKPHAYSTWGSADVSMKFRNNGTAYLTYIDYRKAPDSGGVYITNSINGGINWSAPVRIWNANTEDPTKVPLDRPWFTVDNSSAGTQGTFYITTIPAYWVPAPHRPYLKISKDSGQTWSNYRYIDTTNYLVGPVIVSPMGAPCVAADGALCINYPSYFTSQSPFPKLFMAKSYNKGGTFAYTNAMINPPLVTSSTEYKIGSNMAANPLNANQLASIRVGEATAGDPDIFVTTTNNGGTTWSTLKKVNDDTPGKAQDMVWVNYSNNNKLVAVWRDRRNGSGTGINQSSDIYCAVSNDNGATFQPNIKLSNVTVPYDVILDASGNDFLCCELLNDTVYATWGDIRNPTNKINIYFTKTSIITGSGIAPVLINNESLSFFPNPAKDKLFFKLNDNKIDEADVIIYNISGAKVLESKINKQSSFIDIREFKAGTYLISVRRENRMIYSDRVIIEE